MADPAVHVSELESPLARKWRSGKWEVPYSDDARFCGLFRPKSD